MNRKEHLQWCKDRAMVYVKADDLKQAFASFGSDMRKHPDTQYHLGLGLGAQLFYSKFLNTAPEMEKWILSFN